MYGHADLLASRCARGCAAFAPCISDRDRQRICVKCAAIEIIEDVHKADE